jgi:hypothetical protein
MRRLGLTDGQSVNIEAPASKHACDSGQHAELVFNVDRNYEFIIVITRAVHINPPPLR